MDLSDKTQIGRLALRREGIWWNAYYAMPETMEDAIHLGSIRMTTVEASEPLKQAFVDEVSIVWPIANGVPYEKLWRITFARTMESRGDERPMFVYGYRAGSPR